VFERLPGKTTVWQQLFERTAGRSLVDLLEPVARDVLPRLPVPQRVTAQAEGLGGHKVRPRRLRQRSRPNPDYGHPVSIGMISLPGSAISERSGRPPDGTVIPLAVLSA
jgi:hypothetical protein